jgi:hypothetical protein
VSTLLRELQVKIASKFYVISTIGIFAPFRGSARRLLSAVEFRHTILAGCHLSKTSMCRED